MDIKSLSEYDAHDQEVIGYIYHKNLRLLKLFLINGELNFNSVIFFEFNDITTQNIIFDIKKYINNCLIPNCIVDRFPTLEFYLRQTTKYDVFYVSSSVGLDGIIVCSAS